MPSKLRVKWNVSLPWLQLLGYDQWRNFAQWSRRQMACEVRARGLYFADVGKMVDLNSGGKRGNHRYACYLIAQNGDQRKSRLPLLKPILPCKPVEMSWLSSAFWNKSVFLRANWPKQKKSYPRWYTSKQVDRNFGIIRSKGEKALFGKPADEGAVKC